MGPGLIWGLDFSGDGQATPVGRCDQEPAGCFRWLHLNLADQGAKQWIAAASGLSPLVRDLLLSPDQHQRALLDGDSIGCVFHDFERDFDVVDTGRVGVLRIALTPRLMLTTRIHPLRSIDIARFRLERDGGAYIQGPAQALELLVGAITANVTEMCQSLSIDVQAAEDAFLDGRAPPQPRDLIHIRRRLARIHRLMAGMRGALHRLEEEESLPHMLLPTVERLAQRLQSVDADIIEVQGQLRLLRDEMDMQAAQRTNQNLYILSIVTALMLPATLVTGVFGMNTGGMPLSDGPMGTLIAIFMAALAAAASYWFLRWKGFIRR